MLMMQQEHRWSSGLGRMARAELMLSLLEGLLSGTVSSCCAGRSIVTTEAAGSAVRCLVPVKTPRANDSRGKAEKVGNQHSPDSQAMRASPFTMPALTHPRAA